MIVERNVFQAKYGRGDELVALFQELRARMDEPVRILVDVTGPYFTVETEIEYESLAAWEQMMTSVMADADNAAWFQEWSGRMNALVDHGGRTFYRVID